MSEVCVRGEGQRQAPPHPSYLAVAENLKNLVLNLLELAAVLCTLDDL